MSQVKSGLLRMAAASASRRDVLEGYRRHVNSGFARLADFMAAPVEVRSAGSLIVDDQDREYLDCGGYGVFLLGHCHPAVISAVRSQLEHLPLSSRLMLNRALPDAATALAEVTPAGLEYVLFTNSGAEATEAGMKIARLNGATRFIAMHGGFHGKTLGALSVTGRPRYQAPVRDLLIDVTFIPFADPEALEAALQVDNQRCCVILEPVQAEGGVVVPPDGYLRRIAELCRRHNAFLVIDEIQTGLGRLGWWWGADREAVVPDVLLVGKGLSGGVMPVGAAVASAAAFEPLNRDPLLHTSTFGGNPLAMAAASAAIATIQNEHLVQRTRSLGGQLLDELKRALAPRPTGPVRDVRGLGLLIGVEFATEDLAGEFMLELLQRRVIVSHSLNATRVVRFTPPATLTSSEHDCLLEAVDGAASVLHQFSPPQE